MSSSCFLHLLINYTAHSSEYTQNTIDSLMRESKENFTKKPDVSIKQAQEALFIAQQYGLKNNIAQIRVNLGEILVHFGAFREATDNFNQAIKYYKSKNEIKKQAFCLNLLGDIHEKTENKSLAINNYKKSLILYQSIQFTEGEIQSIGRIGHFHEKQKRYKEALKYQNSALELLNSTFDSPKNQKALILENIGSIYEDLENYKQALLYFHKALTINNRTKNTHQHISIANNIGDCYRKSGLIEKSIKYTHIAHTLALQMNDKPQLYSALKDLAKAYHLTEQNLKAYEFLRDAHKLYKVIYSENNALQISGLQTVHYTKEKEDQIQLLKKDKRIASFNNQLYLIGIVLLISFIGAIVSFYQYRISKKNQIFIIEQELIQRKLTDTLENEKKLKKEIDLKNNSLASYALQSVQNQKVITEVADKLHNMENNKNLDMPFVIGKVRKEVEHYLKQGKDWEEFKLFFEEVHPDFYEKLRLLVPNLTTSEIRLCTLLRLSMRSKDISTVLRVTPDSVRIARYRLRKKLPIKSGEDLIKFIMNI